MFTELSDEQLVHKALAAERDLVVARFSHSAGSLENTAALSVLRKDIARIRTEARRREREQGLAKDALVNAHRSSFASSGGVDGGESDEAKGGFLKGIVDKLTNNE